MQQMRIAGKKACMEDFEMVVGTFDMRRKLF